MPAIAASFPIPSPTELHTPAVCAFCGRGAKDCRWLIGSPTTGAFICDECIANADRDLAAIRKASKP